MSMKDLINSDLYKEIGKSFDECIKQMEREEEEFWNSLSQEDQLKAFCAVSRRIFDGDIKQKRTYRGVLYDVFGFGPDSYVRAQMAGYLAIHNAIYDGESMGETLRDFNEKLMLGASEESICNYLMEKHI